MGKAWVSDGPVSYTSTVLESIEGLTNPLVGTETEIVQLGNGRLGGRLTRATIGEVAFSRASFSLPVRANGVLSQTRVTIGMLLECSGELKAWTGTTSAGDINIFPAGLEHHHVYTGPSAFAAVSLDPAEMTMLFGTEDRLSDPAFWSRRRLCRPDDRHAASRIDQKLQLVFARLAGPATLTEESAEYLKRSVVEAFVAPILAATFIPESPASVSAIKIVREAEHFVDSQEFRPVHISEVCGRLGVSRRALYRSFEDVLGMGPSAFLRHKRLCAVHTALRRLNPNAAHVTGVAMDFGFLELGRFASQYRLLFGEYPNETLRR